MCMAGIALNGAHREGGRPDAAFGTRPRLQMPLWGALRLRGVEIDAFGCYYHSSVADCPMHLAEDDVLSHSDPATGLPVGPRAERLSAPNYTSEEVLQTVLESLDDDKAEEVVQIDLRGRSDVADYMVICSGRSSRQVSSISEKLADRLKEKFKMGAKMEGRETGDWVLIDGSDVIIHVFRPEVREFYQLEKMWTPSAAHRTDSDAAV